MFRLVMSHFATNDAGVEVRGVGRDIFEYREGDHVLLVGRDLGQTKSGDPAHIVHLDHFLKWSPPHEGEAITAADMDRIADNITQAYQTMGVHTFIERSGI